MSMRKPLPNWSTANRIRPFDRPLRYCTFGEAVKRHRRALKISQEKLAKEIGISRNYLSMIECNKADNLSVRILVSLARILGVDACQLLRMYTFEIFDNENTKPTR